MYKKTSKTFFSIIYDNMNSQIYNFSEIMENIKQDIIRHQYKIIMDSFMEIKNGKIETK